ncbi:MAG: hypothetical protein AAGK22_07930 [Acidobacteriota bacterium]
MKLNNETPTASDLIDWATRIFEERVSIKDLDLTEEATGEFLAFITPPAATAAANPRYYRRYWQNIHRLIRDVGTLSASSAEWRRRSEVVAEDVKAAISAYQYIKPKGTILCPLSAEKVALETAVA